VPETWTWGLVAVVGLATIIYGFSKTALPGGGVLAGTLLAAALGPGPGSGFALPLLIVGDLIALSRYRRGANWRIILALLPWVVVGLLVAAALFAVLDRSLLARWLGALILISVGLELRRRRLVEAAAPGSPPPSPPTTSRLRSQAAAGFYGTLAGMTTLAANAGGAAMSLYLMKLEVPMRAFLGTSVWFWFMVNLAKVPLALPLGLITPDTLRADLWFLPLLFAGAALGIWAFNRMSQRLFSNAVLGLSAAAAVWLVVHG